ASNCLLILLLLISVPAFSLAQRQYSEGQLSQEQQCRFRRITASQPSERIEFEGGTSERWDEREDQFQCASVAAVRNVIRPNGLSLPNYQPSPRLVYIERGEGYISVVFPSCAETYHSTEEDWQQRRETERFGRHGGRRGFEGRREEEEEESGRDLHQRVHRIRRGDIIALPAGTVHWCYNDGNEELVAVSINDLNHQTNQLDERHRSFYLAGADSSSRGGGSSRREEGQQRSRNIFSGFDPNLLSEAFNVPEDLIRRVQGEREERGLIVTARERLDFIRSEDVEEEEEEGRIQRNGLEETVCSPRFITNIESRKEADVICKQAGKLNVVDKHKLPILRFMDLSAEKGLLYPNAMVSPDWESFGHTIVYVTRGEAQIQITDQSGESLMNDRVNQGDMFVIPQYYVSSARAGNDGFEWVAFKTTGWPMRNPLAGYTSVIRALPLQVVSNAYQISPSQAHQLKNNRGGQSFLLSP
ncbi:hypothetical protein M569_05912, partial [Genlisea aurea]